MNNVRMLYAARFFQNLIPAYVIERLFWEQRGMTIEMVVFTGIIYAITVLVLEVPSGMISDRWGRKRTVVAGAWFGCFEFLIILYADQFWHFALAVILAGVSYSLASGADKALLYESLQQEGKEELFEKYLGRLTAFELVSAVMAALCGGYLATFYPLELTYWLSLLSMVVALVVSFQLVEPISPNSNQLETPVEGIVQAIDQAIRFFWHHPAVCLVLLVSMMTGAFLEYVEEFWQLYLAQLSIPVSYFGIFSAGMMLVGLPGALLAYRLVQRFSLINLLMTLILVLAGGFFCMAVFPQSMGMISILVICLFSSMMEPIGAGYLHHRVNSSMRATIDSIYSVALNGSFVWVGLGFGYFSSRFELFGGYGFIAVLGFILSLVFLVGRRIIDD